MTAPPRWQHVITDAGHHLRLTGANGEPILTSEVYVDGAGVADALVLARRATSTWSGQQPDLVDQRTPGRDLYAAALADGHYPDEEPDRAHQVEVTPVSQHPVRVVGDPRGAVGDLVTEEVHHCHVCGYVGRTPPPLPCPGPDSQRIVGGEAGVRTVVIPGPLPSQGPRVDRGPGHEAE